MLLTEIDAPLSEFHARRRQVQRFVTIPFNQMYASIWLIDPNIIEKIEVNNKPDNSMPSSRQLINISTRLSSVM